MSLPGPVFRCLPVAYRKRRSDRRLAACFSLGQSASEVVRFCVPSLLSSEVCGLWFTPLSQCSRTQALITGGRYRKTCIRGARWRFWARIGYRLHRDCFGPPFCQEIPSTFGQICALIPTLLSRLRVLTSWFVRWESPARTDFQIVF